MGKDAPRLLFLVVVLLGHAVIICIMGRQTNVSREDQEDEFFSLPIHLMQIVEVEREATRRVDVADPIEKSNLRVPASAAIAVSLPLQSSAFEDVERENTPTTRVELQVPGAEGPRPDWMNAAEEVARQMARPRRKGFGNEPEENMPPGKPREGLFERVAPPHRAGDIEIFEQGIERRWVSSRCYMDFGRIPDLLAPKGPRVNPVRCLLGASEVDTHLFDHLKPRYLRPRQ